MKRYSVRAVLGILLALILVLVWLPAPAFAAQTLQGNTVSVPGNQTINDDLYAFGSTITINGVVNGDVVALGGTVTVNGTVNGAVNVAAGTIIIDGRVTGSVRAAGGDITINGAIGKDALIVANSVTLAASARVNRDLQLVSDSLTLDGQVGRNVKANVQKVRLGGAAVVLGTLSYSSDTLGRAPGAQVRGAVTHVQYGVEWPSNWQAWTTGVWPALAAFAWLRGLLSLSVLGILFLLLAPRYQRRTIATLDRRPWASLGVGLAVLIAVPIAALLVFMLGIVIGGWWLALLAIGIYALAVALSLPLTGLYAGQWVLRQTGARNVWPGAALILGLAVLMLLSVIPYLGALILFVAVLFGLGTLAISLWDRTAEERPRAPETAVLLSGYPPAEPAPAPETKAVAPAYPPMEPTPAPETKAFAPGYPPAEPSHAPETPVRAPAYPPAEPAPEAPARVPEYPPAERPLVAP